MEYKIMIDQFEGPLDLLLHLIKKSNINICDINVVDITVQYLDYINKMESLNLDIASEYLIMAAELIELKSNILLPQPINDEVVDERQDLINRLLDYEQYKNMTTYLKNLEVNRRDEFTKEPEDLKEYGIVSNIYLNNDVNVSDLLNAFSLFLKKKELEKPLNTKVTLKEYSVSKRGFEILDLIKMQKKICFNELFDNYDRGYIVVTFLAILDLAKKNNIVISQDCNFNDICIEEVDV